MVEILESSTEPTVQELDIETPYTEEPVGDPPVKTDLSGHSLEPEASEPIDDGVLHHKYVDPLVCDSHLLGMKTS